MFLPEGWSCGTRACHPTRLDTTLVELSRLTSSPHTAGGQRESTGDEIISLSHGETHVGERLSSLRRIILYKLYWARGFPVD
jgi:hypothetical protein